MTCATQTQSLQGAQDGVVEEGAALNADALAQLGNIAQLDDLAQLPL